jgi:N-sulfoglucosamine sulfohydrolase
LNDQSEHVMQLVKQICLVMLCVFSTSWACADQSNTGPNILLIVAEDMSSRVGAFGDVIANTPAIDALAQQGVRFTQMYSASGVCAPNRSALITGVYPQSMGTQHMRTSNRKYLAVPPPDIKAFPELLRRAGYVTANATKTDYQFGEPFSIWDVNVGGYGNPPDLALWRQLPKERAFFAMINLMSTHESRLATKATQGQGQFAQMINMLVKTRDQQVAVVTNPDLVTVPPYYPDLPAVRASIAQHYDNIQYMDDQVSQILANLEADGLHRNTIVIWTTDHGDGLPRAKRSIYDSGLKVPMVIRYPNGRRAGDIDQRLISAVDIAPTILGMAGIKAPGFTQGRDVFAKDAEPRRYVHAGRDRMDQVPDWVRAVKDGRFKYIRNKTPDVPYFRKLTFRDMFPVMQALWTGYQTNTLNPTQQFYFTAPRPNEELYDTLADPYEVHNLVADTAYAGILDRLRTEMDRWLAEVGDQSTQPESKMIASMWPQGQQPSTEEPKVQIRDRTASINNTTPGASIGYHIGHGDHAGPWQLYTTPMVLPKNSWLEVKAVRYGYKESDVVRLEG